MTRIRSAEFIRGVRVLEDLPNLNLPEIAIVGRSNVGKSSLLNRLTNSSGLARVSATPGRTQEINLFEIELQNPRVTLVLADLPGFGYSKFNKDQREDLAQLTVEYLQGRKELSLVFLLSDCRRLPEQDERAVQKVVFEAGKSLMVVLTKTDLLTKNQLNQQSRKVAEAYGLEAADLLITSKSDQGDTLWAAVKRLALA